MIGAELFSVYGRIALDARDFERDIDNAENRGRGLGATLGGVGKTAIGMGAAIVAATKGVGIAAMHFGGRIDDMGRSIQSQTGQTTGAIDETVMAIRDMALESRRYSPYALLSGLEGVSRAGQDAAYQIALTEHAMRLADLSGQSFGASIYTIDALLVKFNGDIEEASKWVNTLAVAQQEMSISQSSMLDGLQRSAGIANAARLEYSFLSAALGFAYQGGQSMSTAATGLTGIFNQMLDPTSNIRDAMRELGVETVTNADGTINAQESMIKFMRELDNADPLMREQINNTMSLSGSNLDLFTNIIDNIDALDEQTAMFAYAQKAGDDYARALAMAETRTGGLRNQFGLLAIAGQDKLKTIFELIEAPLAQTFGAAGEAARDFALRLREGGDLHPYVRMLADAITGLVDRVVQFGIAAAPVVMQWLPMAAATLTNVLDVAVPLAPAILGIYAATKAYNSAVLTQLSGGLLQIIQTGALTTGKGLLTAAQVKLNLAMKANPIGLVLAGVVALTGGVIALTNAIHRGSEELQEMRRENERMLRSSEQLVSSVNRSAEAHEARTRAVATDTEMAQRLLGNLRELANAEGDSATTRERMKLYTEELTGIMPELLAYVDEESGLLTISNDAIKRRIELFADEIRAQIERERAFELMREQIELEAQLEEATAARVAKEEYGLDAMTRFLIGSRRHNEALGELKDAEADLEAQLERNERQFDALTKSVVETAVAKDEYTQASKVAKDASQDQKKALSALRENGLVLLGEAYTRAADRATDAFTRMNRDTSKSISEQAATLTNNAQMTREWGENVATLMQEAMERGVDEGVLQSLYKMAHKGPGYADMMANDIEGVFNYIVPALEDASEAAMDKVVSVYGAYREDVEEAAAMVSQSGYMGMLRYLDEVNMRNLGATAAMSVANSILAQLEYLEGAGAAAGKAVETGWRYVMRQNSPSQTFIELAEGIMSSAATGIDRGTPRAIQSMENASDSIFDAATAWIPEYRQQLNHSMTEELAMWEYLATVYGEHTTERLRIDQEAARLRAQIDQDSFNHSRKYIERRKFFGTMSLQEEVAAWERVQSRFAQGTQEREQADRNLFTARNRLIQEQERIKERMVAAEERHQQQLERTTQSIFNSFRLFPNLSSTQEDRQASAAQAAERVLSIEQQLIELRQTTNIETERLEREETRLLQQESEARAALREAEKYARMTDAQMLIAEAQARLDTARNYADNLSALSEQGISDAMLSEKTKEQIAIMADMTEAELREFAAVWDEGFALAGEMAVRQMLVLREETDYEVRQLAAQLEHLSGTVFVDAGKSAMQGYSTGFLKGLVNIGQSMQSKTFDAPTLASGGEQEDLLDFGPDLESKVEMFKTSFAEITQLVLAALENLSRKAMAIIRSLTADMHTRLTQDGRRMGQAFFRALGDGLIAEEAALLSRANWVADAIRRAFGSYPPRSPAWAAVNAANSWASNHPQYQEQPFSMGVSPAMAATTITTNQYFYGVREERTAYQAYKAAQRVAWGVERG